MSLAVDEPLKLRVFIDRSVIELFANEHACMTSRIYPTRADSRGVKLFARGGSVHVTLLEMWELNSSWA